MEKKLYRVQIGLADDGEGNECSNWSSTTVIATDASAAIKKARMKKNEYPESVTMVAVVDRP